MCATLALWLHHAAVHICNSNFKLFQNFMSWCCFIFQQPDVKPGFAPVLVSKVEGVGKGCLLAPLHEILGKHSVTFNGIGDMVNQFNTAIKDKKLIIAHEVDMQVQRGGGDRNSPMGTLKGLVTDRSVMLTAKYAESEQALSRTALALTSNKTNAGLDVGENSRRWQFFEPWDRRLPDHIGQLISGDDGSPRSQVFLSQLLHLFCTLDCNENRARNIMHVNQTFHAEAGPLQQRFPFIKSLVEAVEASKTNAALALNKKIGVASLLRHRRGLAGNPDVALESDLAVQAGITIAPINTVRDRLRALQCGIEDTEPAFTALKEFRMWVLKRLEDDEDIAWMNVNRDEFLELVKSQDKRTLMPACTDGWRAFVQVITNKPYDHILSVLDSSINRGDADVCAEFTDRCHEEATTTGDRMWREVLDGIHWVEYNCREDSGVYSPVWRVGNEQRGMPLLELPEEAKLPRTARLLRMIVDGANATGHYEEPGAINQVIGAIATHLADIEEEDGADGAPLEEHLCKAFDQISPLTQVGPDLLKNVRASHKRTTCLFVRMIELPAFDVSLVQRRAGTNWTAVVEAIIKEEDGADDEVDEEEHMQMIAALIEETDARPEIMKLLVPGCKLDLTLKDWNAVAYFLTNNIALTRPFSGREASLLTYTTSTFRQFWDQFLPGRESPQELDVLLWGDIYLFIKDVCSRIKDGVLVVRFTYDFDWYHVWSMVHDY